MAAGRFPADGRHAFPLRGGTGHGAAPAHRRRGHLDSGAARCATSYRQADHARQRQRRARSACIAGNGGRVDRLGQAYRALAELRSACDDCSAACKRAAEYYGVTLWRLELGLAVGTPALAALGLMVSALTAGLRSSGALAGLLALPLAVPLLIFGAGMLTSESGAPLKFLEIGRAHV